MADFEIEESDKCIRLWLSRRLPLEPTGDLLSAKMQLRTALARLRVPNDRVLFGTYSTLHDAAFDVENVLYYNVGRGVFAHASRNGLGFRRLRDAPTRSPGGALFQHLHEYSFVASPPPPKGDHVVSFTFGIPKISSSMRTHEYWWLASAAEGTRCLSIEGRYQLHIDLRVRESLNNPAAILKSLVDGIVAAMHTCTSPSQLAVDLIARKAKWNAGAVMARLKRPANPVLGNRVTVSPYRGFVKWDPADDLCDCGVLNVRRGSETTCTVSIVALTRSERARCLTAG